MQKYITLLAFLFSCSAVATEFNGIDRNDAEINFIECPTFTSCGGVIPLYWNDGYYSAHINYKYNEPYANDEFCVWTVIADNSIGSVWMEFHDQSNDTKDGIVVYSWNDFNLTTHKIPHGNSILEINAPTLSIAFSSNYNMTFNGFIVDFIVTKAVGAVDVNPEAYFSGLPKGELTYPRITGKENYDNDEQVSVVLHGPYEWPRLSREYRLRDLDIERDHDFVDVYVLQPYGDSYAQHYEFIRRLSGQHVGLVKNSKVITPFPMLYLFSSDRKGTGKGFTITWKQLRNEVDDAQDFLPCS